MTTTSKPAAVEESERAWAELPEIARVLAERGRELGSAAVMFHAVVAEKLGLSITDHKCLDIATRAEGPLTAGRIAELSGLSTGAVTGVIDRLERAGYVRRVRDPHDRRKVIVEITNRDWKAHLPMFDGLRRAIEKVSTNYTPEEIDVIVRYTTEMAEAMRTVTAELRDLHLTGDVLT